MTDTKLELVARAIREASGSDGLTAEFLARAAISAHISALAQEGYVIVPRVPSAEMAIAGDKTGQFIRPTSNHEHAAVVVYAAMLAAAPPHKEQDPT